jgi:hypothetical protein
LECRLISPELEHRVLKGKLGFQSAAVRPINGGHTGLKKRVCRLRWTKRTWRAMAVAAQTAAAAQAAAASLDSYIVDGRCIRLEANVRAVFL